MINSFFDALNELYSRLNIEPHDQEILNDFSLVVTKENVSQMVARVNDMLWSSYLVWDVINQEFRLYKTERYND